jgi:hypothetical protein
MITHFIPFLANPLEGRPDVKNSSVTPRVYMLRLTNRMPTQIALSIEPITSVSLSCILDLFMKLELIITVYSLVSGEGNC